MSTIEIFCTLRGSVSISSSTSISSTYGKSTSSTSNKYITAGITQGSIRVNMSCDNKDICDQEHTISIVVLLHEKVMPDWHLGVIRQPGSVSSPVILVTATRIRLIGRPCPTR
jgi:hypothetical protein